MKDDSKRMKLQATDSEKIFTNLISYKRIISRIYVRILKTQEENKLDLKKNGQRMWTDTSSKRYKNDKWAHKKMLDIMSH